MINKASIKINSNGKEKYYFTPQGIINLYNVMDLKEMSKKNNEFALSSEHKYMKTIPLVSISDVSIFMDAFFLSVPLYTYIIFDLCLLLGET